MYIMSANISVDTFFMLSGLFTCYTILKHLEKTWVFLIYEKWVNSNGRTKKLYEFASRRGRINIPLLYFHRYLRLTPLLAAVILLYTSLIRYTGSGPQWPTMVDAINSYCAANWWKTLLFIQNYVSPDNMASYEFTTLIRWAHCFNNIHCYYFDDVDSALGLHGI